jgi:drug/metabolite transporter (DMT)-like permease
MSIALEDVSVGIGMLGGDIAALAAAALWALATVCFGRIVQFLAPLKMNLLKNVLGALMLAVTLAAGDNLTPAADRRVILIFLLSGAVGIGIGDSAYFGALQRLGARRSLLMLVLAPPLTAIASGFFLGERLSVAAWLAVGFTTAGVAWVISERTSSGGRLQHPSLSGIGLGLVAMLGQTAGAVLSHAAFLGSEMTAMQSALWRLAGGTGIVLLLLPLDRQRARQGLRGVLSLRLCALMVFTVFIGTYLGLSLQQLSLKLAPAGVAQTLLSTSPLFVLPLAAWTGERVTLRACLGAAIAVAGIALLFST